MIEFPKLEKIFTHQKPDETQMQKYIEIRQMAKNLSFLIQVSCGDCDEKEISIQKLRECVMWANAGIALS